MLLDRAQALRRALEDHTACIFFRPDGSILGASDAFLAATGYRRDQVVGQHHRMFCSSEVHQAPDYQHFWQQLAAGHSRGGTFERRDARGETLWLEATYLPVMTRRGRVRYIIKIARDVSERHESASSQDAILTALNTSMAVIEFAPDGTVLKANDNFLKVMGYQAHDVIGQHHRHFCADSFYEENPDFWYELANNSFKQGRFARIRANGSPIWLEATYNPVLDAHGKVVRVIKFASDITAEMQQHQATRDAVTAARTSAQQTETIAADGLTQLAAAVEDVTRAGMEVATARQVIEALNHHVRSINQMAESISHIAQQTNLLALNAAVEAARAGDHGRGFAVVAHEVRRLSQATTQSAEQISKVLRDNTALIRQAGERMNTVVIHSEAGQQSVDQTQAVIAEILAGARQVSAAIDRL
ncbi:PAS domain S-box protein [Cobetia sp. cqz5-12]|uniref:methyl-accepting chemotaxis protein n=1 Tax=unclassified Cobetia TaxID=2609414 RepID=UPI001299088A|nr:MULTISPECIES: PAS domain S-box protein [unclassified Cobetia]QQK63914.1 PAS domain S-box protein [Cobetia sp. cqz5-12]BBO56039.1 methyl-accepting chemotaxis protein [Cobetia sp. AM6]